MKPLRVLAVDDEPLSLRRMKLLLQTISYVEQVGEADSCSGALARVAELAPDVVLLDIKMRDGSGIDVAEALATRPSAPAIVFVTAFDRFAARAFETIAADYVLKPIERDRLAQALQRARARRASADAEQRIAELQEIIRNLRSAAGEAEGAARYETEFWLRNGNGFVRIAVESIDWVSSEDEYVRLHTPSGSHLMRGSIRQLEARLDPTRFLRIHRRWLVRRAAIAEWRAPRVGRPVVVLQDGQRLPTGRVYARQLRDVIAAERHR